MPKGFDGKGTIDISNQGNQVHEHRHREAEAGQEATRLKFLFARPPGTPPPAGPPPFDAIPGLGGVTGLSSQQHAWLNMNLTPGNYVLICFFPGTSGKGGSRPRSRAW